jgi:hypothetical protein
LVISPDCVCLKRRSNCGVALVSAALKGTTVSTGSSGHRTDFLVNVETLAPHRYGERARCSRGLKAAPAFNSEPLIAGDRLQPRIRIVTVRSLRVPIGGAGIQPHRASAVLQRADQVTATAHTGLMLDDLYFAPSLAEGIHDYAFPCENGNLRPPPFEGRTGFSW